MAQRRLASVYATSEVYSEALKYSHLKVRCNVVDYGKVKQGSLNVVEAVFFTVKNSRIGQNLLSAFDD